MLWTGRCCVRKLESASYNIYSLSPPYSLNSFHVTNQSLSVLAEALKVCKCLEMPSMPCSESCLRRVPTWHVRPYQLTPHLADRTAFGCARHVSHLYLCSDHKQRLLLTTTPHIICRHPSQMSVIWNADMVHVGAALININHPAALRRAGPTVTTSTHACRPGSLMAPSRLESAEVI